MPSRPILFPYRIHSTGARALAKALNTICVYPDGQYHPKKAHTILCWGASSNPRWWHKTAGATVLNPPHRIAIAINKLRTFEKLEKLGINTPPWTRDRVKALEWQAKERIVVCRKSLTSSAGRGIVVADKSIKLPECYLYTQHVRHKHEFRVHVFNNKVIDVSEKRKRSEFDKERGKLESLIRSWDNGWVFCHEDVHAPAAVIKESLRAIQSLELDFGAVDVGYREKDEKAFIFEVNTAPGIEGQTIERYAQAVREFCK